MGVVDATFPLYLSNVSTLRIGTSAVFVLIALVWFYVLALIVLAGAVVNELRFERVRNVPRELSRRRYRTLPHLDPPLQHRLRLRGRARVGPVTGRARTSRRHRPSDIRTRAYRHRTAGPESSARKSTFKSRPPCR